MARLSELVDAVAEVTGVARNNVILHARLAREAGFIQQGGRGLSAPTMGARDAAILLGALIASPTAKETESTLHSICAANSEIETLNQKLFGHIADTIIETTPPLNQYLVPECLSFTSMKHSFIDAIEKFIANEREFSRKLGEQCVIKFYCDNNPYIEVTYPWLEFDATALLISYKNTNINQTGDLQYYRTFSWKTISAVSDVLL